MGIHLACINLKFSITFEILNFLYKYIVAHFYNFFKILGGQFNTDDIDFSCTSNYWGLQVRQLEMHILGPNLAPKFFTFVYTCSLRSLNISSPCPRLPLFSKILDMPWSVLYKYNFDERLSWRKSSCCKFRNSVIGHCLSAAFAWQDLADL